MFQLRNVECVLPFLVFAWWDHGDLRYPIPTATPTQIAKRRSFRLAAANIDQKCRAVIVYRKRTVSVGRGRCHLLITRTHK